MSSIRAVQPSPIAPGTRPWSRAAARVQNFLSNLVVTVESTDEMNEVWKLYRLTNSSGSVRPAVVREPAASARP